MKKIPRDISATELIKLLGKQYGYVVIRQTGSHIRLTSTINGEHHITIPNHNPIKLGTLSSILNDVSIYLQKTKEKVVEELF